MPSKYSQRFQELRSQIKAIEASKKSRYDSFSNKNEFHIEYAELLNWQVKAENLLDKACGADSSHIKAFKEAAEHGMYITNYMRLERMSAVFFAAEEDFNGGYLSSVRTLVQAEVFASELERAVELLAGGYKIAAAVVAGIVLETALRELCDRQNIPHSKLDKMNADLAKAGTYNLLQQKRITAFAHIRNDAAHGKPDQFTDADVKSMIADIERFLADHLT